MIKSMTGFGRSISTQNAREYQIEIKSVNHKYSDISIKMPRSISFLEEKVKEVISNKIKRGKVDVFITVEDYGNIAKNIIINKEVAKIYIQNLKEIAREEQISESINIEEIAKLPDVLIIKNNQNEEELEKEIVIVTSQAVEKLIEMKTIEGEKIYSDLLERINTVEKNIEEISALSTGLIDEYVVKLEARIKEILRTEEIDKSRLAQEVVIYADKCSVEEEITRLKSHVSQLRELLNADIAVGKKLDFIIQEMNRETNTIGSKSGSLEITNRVIEIKTELEDIREQIQNIE